VSVVCTVHCIIFVLLACFERELNRINDNMWVTAGRFVIPHLLIYDLCVFGCFCMHL
jgi:hypothetical protein